VCAVTRRRFPVGANPTRQPLQPEAIGAVMEVTKWLKPSISVSRIGDSASVQAVNPSDNIALAYCLASISVGNDFDCLGEGARDKLGGFWPGLSIETYQ
jgi:hypothetical protein